MSKPRKAFLRHQIAVAVGYARNQWGPLTRFLDDGRLRLDNNPAERQLRRVAIGRNYADHAVMPCSARFPTGVALLDAA